MNNAAKDGAVGLPAHETVYRQLRDMVLYGDLAPGQPVTIQGLVQHLDVGMTPVREGLRRLTAEGALDALGNRRISVPVLDAGAVEQLTFARLQLESDLARRAAQRVEARHIQTLRETDDRLDAAISGGNIQLYLRENHRFHSELNQVAAAPILTSVVEGLWLRFGPSLRVVCGQLGTRSLPDRHKDLLDALERNNCEDAAQAMRDDVQQGMDLIAQALGDNAQ